MSDNTRKLLRLALLALTSAMNTGIASLLSAYTAGIVTKVTWIIVGLSILGAVCTSIQGSLSQPPGVS